VVRVRPGLFVGPSVHPSDLPRLHRAGITAILSLQEPERDLPAAAIERMRQSCQPRIELHNVAVPDYDPRALIDRLASALHVLHNLLARKRIVYVHCSEGVNRAPSVALAHLVRHEGLDVDAAVAELQRAYPGARPYGELVEWLRRQDSGASSEE
jgi:protein-tyrosine phosphatase